MNASKQRFRWDVFISYASVDDVSVLDGPSWVGDFFEALVSSLDALSGRRERIRVFRDKALRKTERFSEALDRHVEECAVFLALQSPGFEQSSFCQRELRLFTSAARRPPFSLTTSNGLQRVIPVRLAGRNTLRTDPVLSEVIGHDFAEDDNSHFPIGSREPEFLTRIRKLAQDIMAIVDDLHRTPASIGSDENYNWIPDDQHRLVTQILAAPVLRLNDEDRRFNLLSRAYGARVPALYHYLRRGGGNIDEWVGNVVDEAVRYGAVDANNALSLLLEALSHDSLTDTRALDDARTMVGHSWEIHERESHKARLSTGMHLQRILGIADAHIVMDEPESAYTSAWEVTLSDKMRRISIIRNARMAVLNDDYLDRLRRLAELHHANILPISDFLTDGSVLFSECGFRSRSTLSSLAGPLGLTDIRDYVLHLADALDYAHLSGVVHGRLSPSCVLLNERLRFVTLMGFGYAQSADSAVHQLTWSMPRPPDVFNPPELAISGPSPAGDQYSLGALVYSLLLGPEREYETLEGFRSAGSEHLPDAVSQVVERAMALDPAERFQSTMEFADAFRWALETGIQQSSDRAVEHRYLSLMRSECLRSVSGYVKLRGTKDKLGASAPANYSAITGAGRVSLRHPIIYRISSPRTLEGARLTEDISRDLREGGRVLLLGDPGSGKTTTLIHAALEACREAQLNIAAPIPVVVPLNLYDSSMTILEFVKSQMADLADHFDRLLVANRLLLFFDALNEMGEDGRDRLRSYVRQLDDFVISCRTRDYERDLDDLTKVTLISIMPLDVRTIKLAFERILGSQGVRLWSTVGGCAEILDRYTKMQRREEADRFWESGYVPEYTSKPEDDAWQGVHHLGVIPLCQNPFLLRVVAEIFRSEGKVPENRSAIFETSVTTLIRRELARLAEFESWTDVDLQYVALEEVIRRALTGIAGLIQARQDGAGIDRQDALRELAFLDSEHDEASMSRALAVAEDASILERAGTRLVFSHQLLQEYFASSVMRAAFEAGEAAEHFFPGDSWYKPHGWEETSIILTGVLGSTGIRSFVEWLAMAQPTVALRCVAEAGVAGWSIEDIPADLREWLIELWLTRWHDELGCPQARAAIGRALAIVGDRRPGVGLQDGVVPDIEWVPLSGGKLSVSRYPITVKQFRCFETNTRGIDPTSGLQSGSARTSDGSWNSPATNIAWERARQFGEWLAELTGWRVRLPWEYEWKRAAFAGEGVEPAFPWGDCWTTGRGNVADGTDDELGSASAVGVFDDGSNSICDLFGNVWEWCLDSNVDDKRQNDDVPLGGRYYLLKGGSWKRSPDFAAVGYRYWAEEGYSSDDVGFRLVRERDG